MAAVDTAWRRAGPGHSALNCELLEPGSPSVTSSRLGQATSSSMQIFFFPQRTTIIKETALERALAGQSSRGAVTVSLVTEDTVYRWLSSGERLPVRLGLGDNQETTCLLLGDGSRGGGRPGPGSGGHQIPPPTPICTSQLLPCVERTDDCLARCLCRIKHNPGTHPPGDGRLSFPEAPGAGMAGGLTATVKQQVDRRPRRAGEPGPGPPRWDTQSHIVPWKARLATIQSPRNESPQPVTQSLHPGTCPEQLPETRTRRNAPGRSSQQEGPERWARPARPTGAPSASGSSPAQPRKWRGLHTWIPGQL